MLAKGGFHRVQLDPHAPDLYLSVFAAGPLEQPVGPLAHEIACPEKTMRGRGAGALEASSDTTSVDPKPQRNVGPCNDQFPNLPVLCGTSGLIDHGQVITRKRVTDGNPQITAPVRAFDEPLHDGRFGGRINRLDRCLGSKPGAQQRDVIPQCSVSSDSNKSKGVACLLLIVRHY
jgi:hypothetical protein